MRSQNTTRTTEPAFLWLLPQKPIPSNAVTPNYTPGMAACDRKIAVNQNRGQASDLAILKD